MSPALCAVQQRGGSDPDPGYGQGAGGKDRGGGMHRGYERPAEAAGKTPFRLARVAGSGGIGAQEG